MYEFWLLKCMRPAIAFHLHIWMKCLKYVTNIYKHIDGLDKFNRPIKNWKPENCPCRIRKKYIPNVDFLQKAMFVLFTDFELFSDYEFVSWILNLVKVIWYSTKRIRSFFIIRLLSLFLNSLICQTDFRYFKAPLKTFFLEPIELSFCIIN